MKEKKHCSIRAFLEFNILNRELSNENGSWGALKKGLKKTRNGLLQGFGNLVLGKKEIDVEVFETLETALLRADVGVGTTKEILVEFLSH